MASGTHHTGTHTPAVSTADRHCTPGKAQEPVTAGSAVKTAHYWKINQRGGANRISLMHPKLAFSEELKWRKYVKIANRHIYRVRNKQF